MKMMSVAYNRTVILFQETLKNKINVEILPVQRVHDNKIKELTENLNLHNRSLASF
jgi:hypothetical protein